MFYMLLISSLIACSSIVIGMDFGPDLDEPEDREMSPELEYLVASIERDIASMTLDSLVATLPPTEENLKKMTEGRDKIMNELRLNPQLQLPLYEASRARTYDRIRRERRFADDCIAKINQYLKKHEK